MAKLVRPKAKVGPQSSFCIQEIDQQVFWESRPAHTTAYKIQSQKAIKDDRKDRSRAKTSVSISTQDSEPYDKTKKDKKKK